MSGNRIARVRWYLGQTLLPDHFRSQDEALTAEIRLVAAASGLPAWGISRLTWSPELLPAGTLSLSALTCVFPGGALVDLPGNAACTPLSLEETGRVRLSVYLHLTQATQPADGNRLYEEDPSTVQRVVHRLRLSTESAVDDMVDTLRLADMEKDVSGVWRIADGWLPPLLTVGAHPFLRPAVERIQRVLGWYDVRLRAQHVDSYASRERLGSVRRAFMAVATFRARLVDLDHGVDMHPFELFELLRDFHHEICCLDEVLPEAPPPPYQHESLADTFEPLLRVIERRVTPTPDITHHEPFVRTGDLFRLAPLPDEVQKAAESYLLVQRPSAGQPLSLSGIKVASPARLPIVQQLVLTGVPLKHVQVPPFRHPFGPNIDFYRLSAGEEWEHVLREQAVVFQAPPTLHETRFALFWRNG